MLVEQPRNDARVEEALPRSVSGESVSRANGSSSPRSHAAAGIEKPRFFAVTIARGSSGSAAFRSSPFFAERPHLVLRRQREREAR